MPIRPFPKVFLSLLLKSIRCFLSTKKRILLVPDERVIIYEITEKPIQKSGFRCQILYATENRFSKEKIVFGRRTIRRGIFLDTLIPNIKIIKQT